MIKCEICGKEFKNLIGLSIHIKKYHKINTREYYLSYIGNQGKCKMCEKDTSYMNINLGFREYCSLKCSNNCQEVKDKQEKTCLKNNGVKRPYQNEKIKNRGGETCLKNNGYKNPAQNKKIAKKISDGHKLTFSKLLKKYPELVKIENLIEGPNGEILGHCKNANCHNSSENGGSFTTNVLQLKYRNQGINSTNDGNYLYCCEECKKECILFGKSANQLDNIFNQEELFKASPQDLSIWRNEVFIRQLKDNQLHKENFCEICHKTENLVGHHILPQKLYPEYALDPINGVILCSKCHNKYGHKIGTECSTGYLANKVCK